MEAILKVDDTNIPDPTSITISRNKVWGTKHRTYKIRKICW